MGRQRPVPSGEPPTGAAGGASWTTFRLPWLTWARYSTAPTWIWRSSGPEASSGLNAVRRAIVSEPAVTMSSSRPHEQVTDDEQCPAFRHQLNGSGDHAVLPVCAGGHSDLSRRGQICTRALLYCLRRSRSRDGGALVLHRSEGRPLQADDLARLLMNRRRRCNYALTNVSETELGPCPGSRAGCRSLCLGERAGPCRGAGSGPNHSNPVPMVGERPPRTSGPRG